MLSVKSPHKASQSGHDGSLGTIGRVSGPSHGGGGGAGLRDGLAVKNSSSIKEQIVDRDASSLLKAELISESHKISKSSVIRLIHLRTLGDLCAKRVTFSRSQGDS